ncbi:hypothetical protein MBLNU230_g7723t1 [Neophaeotheca triangularis]
MTRGNAAQTKVHHKGNTEDFIVFVESAAELEAWKKDKTVPLAQVVSGWKIFVTHKHGNQGILDSASKGQLEDEFGTTKDDEVVTKILEQGTVVESEEHGRMGDRNATKGPSAAH